MVTDCSGKVVMDWLLPRLAKGPNRWVHHVNELLPSGYDSYLRLFHPFFPWTSEGAEAIPEVQLRSWESLAGEAGVVFHGELDGNSLEPVTGNLPDGSRRYVNLAGEIERSTANRMIAVLAANGPAQGVYFV